MQLPAHQELVDALPISHLSYSSIKSYCEDQQSFCKGYIQGERDKIEVTPSYVIGTGVHTGVETYRIHQLKLRESGEIVPMTVQDFVIMAHARADQMIRTAEKDGTMLRGVKQNRETVMNTIKETIEAYVDKPPRYKPLYIEAEDIVDFSDFEGEEMSIPLKVKIDMIAEDEQGDLIIVDHKTTSSGYEKEESDIAPDFDLQAGAYYIGCMSITGRAPKKMIFDQIFKTKSNPFKGMLQKDLREMCEKHNIPYERYHKNEELKAKLLEAGVVEMPDIIQKYEIDFSTNMQPVKAFIYLYKQVVLDLYIKTIHNLPYIINPFKQFGGDISYKHWLKEIA